MLENKPPVSELFELHRNKCRSERKYREERALWLKRKYQKNKLPD